MNVKKSTTQPCWHVQCSPAFVEVEAACAGPELGPLAGLMVGPEQGGWQVDEVTVVSSRTAHVDRYSVHLFNNTSNGHIFSVLLCLSLLLNTL